MITLGDNMKIIIVSDSHGKRDVLYHLLEEHQDADAFLHCGDIELAESEFPMYQTVTGNNDLFTNYPLEKVIEVGEHRIYMTHGHILNIRNRHDHLIKKAKEHGCDIACYGHSHISVIEEKDGVLIINPGSVWRSRDGKGPSYAILNISETGMVAQIKFL